MILLTVDLGNSRCKLRLWSTERVGTPEELAGTELESTRGISARARAWLAKSPRAEGGATCSVVSEELESELAAALRDSVSGSVEMRPDPGLEVACREPEKVGRDRLFGARAAVDLARGSAIVVDAGTALTVDAVRADRTFLGGAIAPGPDLLARALAEGTARLPRIDPRPGGPALGLDTAEALRAGIGVGLRGSARELARRVAEEAGIPTAAVVLTGGARSFLLDPPVFDGARLIEERDLVHLGLLAARGVPIAPRRGTP